jgi:NADPH:quinone reductase-like Zn-dependent oxidoreductase
MTTTNRTVSGFNVIFMFDKLHTATKAMEQMLAWIREGRIPKMPVTLFPLERAADAHRAIESGKTTGKLILTV